MNDAPLSVESNRQIEVVGTEVKVESISREQALIQLEQIGEKLRELIVSTKRLPREGAFSPHQDPVRSLSLAQSHLQTGFMWLRRAIENPKVF